MTPVILLPFLLLLLSFSVPSRGWKENNLDPVHSYTSGRRTQKEGVSLTTTSSFISNTQFRTTTTGDIVGAQDGNIVNVRIQTPSNTHTETTNITDSGDFALVGILYGMCPFTACQNQTFGACGFAMDTFRVWTSPDLSQNSWTLLPGEILPAAQRPLGIYFRPHIIYNAFTNTFVLWVRWLNVTGPTLSDDATLYLTATSTTTAIDGAYTVSYQVVPMFYNNSADDNLFVDPDTGVAYIAHTCRACATHIVIEELSSDYTYSLGYNDSTKRSALVGPGGTEAPAIFKYNGRYYVTMTPLCCYCVTGSPTLVYMSTSTSVLGPFIALPSLGNAPRGQQNFIFMHPFLSMRKGGGGGASKRVAGWRETGEKEEEEEEEEASDNPLVLFAANRWGSDPTANATHSLPLFDKSLQYWYPLQINDTDFTIAPIEWIDNFTITVTP